MTERLQLPDLVTWPTFPFEGEFRVKALEAPVLPEPARHGEAGPGECSACAAPDSDYLWTDTNWRLRLPQGAGGGLAAAILLEPREHYDSVDLPAHLTAELGLVMQRVERAIFSLGGIGRVHMSKWGDGAAHLHWWFFGRPEGMMQLRGTFLTIWDDILPALPDSERQRVADHLRAELTAT